MEQLKLANNYLIHSYKHNGKIHKSWSDAIFIEDHQDYLIFANDKTIVKRDDGRSWETKNPSVMFFFKKHWFSVIAQIKPYGIQYKCDIASPYIIEGNTLKYIDYDLDLKIFTNGAFKILDRKEYEYHRKKMKYPDKLDNLLKEELSNLIEMVRKKENPFNNEYVLHYHNKYKEIEKK